MSVRIPNSRLDHFHVFTGLVTYSLMTGAPECKQKITGLFPGTYLTNTVRVKLGVRFIIHVKLEQL